MITYGLRQLLANKTRLALTGFAIMLAVGFTSAAFVLGTGYRESILGWGKTQTAGLDILVEPESPFDGPAFEINPARIDDDTLVAISSTPGVASARPVLWTDNLIRQTLPDGTLIEDKFSVSTYGWVEGSNIAVESGTAPGPGEFTIDGETGRNRKYEVGRSYDVATPTGTRSMQLSAFTKFVDPSGNAAGQVVLTIPMAELRETLASPGYARIHLNLVEGADPLAVKQSLEASLPAGLDVQTLEEAEALLEDRLAPFVQGFRGGLLAFAIISVFVSAFTIHNTFTMLLSQRTRELGLLRAVGANERQILTSVAVESALLGTVASVIGIGVGLILSYGMSALLRAIGGLPAPDLALSPGIVALSLAVGIGMTVASAIGPARAASRVPVMSALRSGLVDETGSSKRRLIIGAMVTFVGAAAAVAGLAGVGTTQMTLAALGGGALLLFVGIATLNPLWMAPVSRVLGWPLAALFGVPGRIARDNVGRNPRRSATAAASLMVGLALISTVLVVGQSIKERVSSGTERAFRSEYIVSNQLGYKYPGAVADRLEALDVITDTAAISLAPIKLDTRVAYAAVGDIADVDELIDFEIRDAETALALMADPSTSLNPILVAEQEAADRGLSIGDTIPATFLNGEEAELTITGLFGNSAVGGASYYLDRAVWVAQTGQTTLDIIAVKTAPGVSEAAARSALDDFERTSPQVVVRSIDDHVAAVGDSIDQVLGVVNVLMALAILISFLGIANTLALSIFERTRELGLLRAVGMKRRQLRRMIRFEAALLALFGSVLGALIGVAFGVASVIAIPAALADSISIPAIQIVVLLVLAALAGVAAAALPAWRAGRRPTLDLIGG